MKAMLMLEPGETFTLPDARGAVLRVVRGRIWLTQHRDPRDIMLEAGKAWTIDRPGAAVVEAQNDAGIVITESRGDSVPFMQCGKHWRDWCATRLARAMKRPDGRHVPYF
jgi:hypothetical protein